LKTLALVVSEDGTTHVLAAGSRIVEVDADQYASDPGGALEHAERLLTVPPDSELHALVGAYRDPPAGTPDPTELALTRTLADVAFGAGGLDETYRILPAIHDGNVVLLFGESTPDGLLPIGELWPPRSEYTTIPAGEGDNPSEPLLTRPAFIALDAATFPRFGDGSTGDAIVELSAATPATLLLAIDRSLADVRDGIYSGEPTAENRAIGIDIALVLAETQLESGTRAGIRGRVITLTDDDIEALATSASINVPAGPHGQEIIVRGDDFDADAIAALRAGRSWEVDGFKFISDTAGTRPEIGGGGGAERTAIARRAAPVYIALKASPGRCANAACGRLRLGRSRRQHRGREPAPATIRPPGRVGARPRGSPPAQANGATRTLACGPTGRGLADISLPIGARRPFRPAGTASANPLSTEPSSRRP
jgi:hypothetical protein